MTKIITALGICFATSAFAQVDPSSASLFRSRGDTPEKEQLDTSRYSVRPLSSRSQNKESNQPKVEKSKSVTKTEVKVAETTEEKVEVKTETVVEPVPTQEVAVATPKEHSGVVEKVQYILLGGTQDEVEDYRKILHPLDTRLNLFELSIAPSYIYNESRSNYWFRHYHNDSPGLSVAADLWFTPFFGIHTSYLSSMSTEMRANPEGSKYLHIDHQWFDGGIRFRKFFGISRKASQLSVGFDYSDYRMKVPSDADQRVGIKSTGIKLSIEAVIPSTNTFSWTLGAELVPRLSHKEKQTELNLKSGSSANSNRIGASLGWRYTFDRYNQVFWKLSHTVEKNLFDGTANTADPLSGTKPEGIGVTNSFSMFQFGYIWGN